MEPKVMQRCHQCAGLRSSIQCGNFTKYVESINTGLVPYYYFMQAEKTKSDQNVIILQNRKYVELSSWNTQRLFENCIETCPLCINIYKRAKRYLKSISTLGKRKTLGICSNCGITIQTDPSQCKCNVIFKKFRTSSEDIDIDDHNIKICRSKPNRFTTDFLKNEAENSRLKLLTHSYSDLNRASKKYYGQKSSQKPTDGHQVNIRPLFQSEVDLAKLYITRTCHPFLQEHKVNSPGQQLSPNLSFRKTRLRIRNQPHDQTFQFHFIFPSEKKDLDSRLQVSSSQLLHDIQENRKSNILENKNFSAKTNRQTLPWQRDFSISSLQGKSIELLHDIYTKYREIKTLEYKILEERRSRNLEMKNLGAKTNKQTLPWQSDFSLLSLEGKTLELLHDIRAKYMETKLLEDKILDLGKKNLDAKSDKRILPWERDFSHLGLEGNSLELLQYIRESYRTTKIAERRSSDIAIKSLGAKKKERTLPWQRDSSLLGLEEDSLELLHDIRGKYRKKKILENKILVERRSNDLEMKNLGAKTNKKTLPWQRDSSLLSLKVNSLELLNNIQAKYENKKRQLEIIRDLVKKSKKHRLSLQEESSLLNLAVKYEEIERNLEEQRNSDLKKYILGAKTKKHRLPWQKHSSLVNLEIKYEENEKYFEEQRNRDLEQKKPSAKTKKHKLSKQNNYSLLNLKAKHDLKLKHSEEHLEKKVPAVKTKKHELPWQKVSSLVNLEGKYEEKEKYLEEQRSRDLENKIRGANTKKRELSKRKNYSFLNLEAKHQLKQKLSEEQRNRHLEKKVPDVKTKKHEFPPQKDSSLVNLEIKYEENEKYLEQQRSRNLEKKIPGAKTKKHELPWQNDSSLVNLEGKYEEKEKYLEEQRSRDLEKKIRGANTKKHELSKRNNYSLLNLEAKHQLKKKHSEEQRNRHLEKKVPDVKTKKHELARQRDSSLVNLEVKYEDNQKHLKKQRSKDLEKKKKDAKTKDNGLPVQKESSLLYPEVKYDEKQKHLEKRRSKDLETKKHGAKTKDNGLLLQKDSSLLYLIAQFKKKERHIEKQLSKDLKNKKLVAKTKKRGLPWQKDSSLLSFEGNYVKKKRRLDDQLSRDLERTESKNLGATTKKYKLPWQKKDSAHLNLEKETDRITQENLIIYEHIKRYHKKKHGLNKKDDSFNELNDNNSEIDVRVVRKTPKEIEERRKKEQAILELLAKMNRNNTSDISLTTSHPRFLDTDSTELPTEKAVRKMNIYPMVLSRPEFDWFAKNKVKKEMFYDSGEMLAEFSEDGRCRWFYRDGKMALDYYNTEKTPPGRRYVVYSRGKPDRKGRLRPQTVLASFDHSGNAVIFDHAGNIRLKYDQNEGVVLDPSIGPESHWKWHSRNDPPATTDTEMPFRDPEKQMIEEDGLGKENERTHKQSGHKLQLKKTVYEKSKKNTQSCKNFEITMKALIINENFSLKILDQAKVYLMYRDNTTHVKINIGMTLNSMEILNIETCFVGDVFNPLEKFPAETQSLEELQRTLAQARLAERAHVRRLGRLKGPTSISRPMRA